MPLLDTRQVSIWTEDIPKRFLGLLKLSDAIAVYISSPWMSDFFGESSMDLVEALKGKKASSIVLTRPPSDRQTSDFLHKLTGSTRTRIYVNRRLHAKTYIIEGPIHKYVIIGSSNLTNEARGNIEIAVMISGSDIITKRVIYSFLAYLKPMCKPWS